MHDYFDQSYTSSDLRGQALKGAGVTFFIQTCTYIISTIGAVILARLLTPHDFGLVTMVLSFSMVLQNLGPNGFLDATVQRKNLTHTLASTMFWINVGLNFSLMLVFMCSAPLIAWFYREPILKPIVVGMSFTILFACLGTQHQALLLRRMKFLQYSACDLGGHSD